jgi:outer membrane receptor protein involved in Fe transport
LQFGLYHTWRFEDSILIREGVPELDLLNGSATGSRGGRPRHEIEGQAGIFKNGFGARLTANWQSGTEVRGLPATGGGTSSDLFFSDFASVNLRLFANLGQQSFVTKNPWLRGTRVSIGVNNLFNARPNVRDASGTTPLQYQPDYLDPLGRSVTLSIRKLFF